MDTVDSADRLRRATTRLALVLLVLCVLPPLASAAMHLAAGRPVRAAVIAAGTCLVAAAANGWWRHRTARAGKLWAPALLLPAFAAWIATDNLAGLPLVLLAVTTIVSSLGIVAGIVVGLGIAAIMTAVYLLSGAQPVGGVLANTMGVLVLVVLGTLLAYLVDQLRIAQEQVLAGQQQRRQAALEQMDTVLAHDRMQQAQHLHDDLGQRLTLIGMGLDIAARTRGSGPDTDPDEPAWQEVARTREAARDALDELRTLVRALSPDPQAHTAPDLGASLDRLESTFNSTGLQVRIRHLGDHPPAAGDSLAYRVIQEGLTNVVRHSDARRVWIDLEHGSAETTISVTDDGRPADPAGDTVDPGFGLQHLASRVQLAGGRLQTTRNDTGFTLVARYPRGGADA